jgi:hypothetical protein
MVYLNHPTFWTENGNVRHVIDENTSAMSLNVCMAGWYGSCSYMRLVTAAAVLARDPR